MSTSTPWGAAQGSDQLVRGIVDYTTASHGGIHLSPTRNMVVPDYMRNDNGWYEEDCEWSIPATIFPEAWVKYYPNNPDILKTIKDTLRNWYPAIYEKFYNETIKEGESRIRDKNIFLERHKNDYLVISAIATDDMVRCTAHIGGRYDEGCNPKIFIVPLAEYQERGDNSFVIDLDKHVEEVQHNPTFQNTVCSFGYKVRHIDDMIEIAKQLEYPYMLWNDRVYFLVKESALSTYAEDIGLTVDDLMK